MNNTTKINKLLTNVFQQECYLDDSESVYKLQFPNIANISEVETFKDNCKKFLLQYDIEVETSAIFSSETVKTFILQIKKLPFSKVLEKLAILSNDIQLHVALQNGMQSLSLKKGSNFNCKNIYGETPLQIAEQKKDILLGKHLIDALLNSDFKIKKPVFCMQELSNYWDAQIKEFADKLSIQPTAQAVIETVRGLTEERKNITHFFSVKDTSNEDKRLESLQLSQI